ncbi:PEP/pyruvate-binding domain-containing protein [Zoogloea sp. LCSB751]|uniref:PEP/pyruvate-binding domain-containing protein n=1 Tax=Zoogloea sp. LCSB751 TaxID=1965277 RepID=UPI0009A52AF9|nr:PEP/pyruvate-binding domain-containing protein [Zoogloea sp. LCSB751]
MDIHQHVYAIGLPGLRSEGRIEGMGGKAFNLVRMAAIGLPVPQAFILGTALGRARSADPAGFRAPLRDLLEKQVERLEAACGLEFGSGRKPLLVSVRASTASALPTMMDTVLDVGLTDATLRGLLRLTGNPRLAWDSYRRLIQQFAAVVHHASPEPFHAALQLAMEHARVAHPSELDFRALASLARSYLDVYERIIGQPFPQDPMEQLRLACEAIFDAWMAPRAVEHRRMQHIADDAGIAVTVQRMVFGNAGGTSGSGVGFTRNPATGEAHPCLAFRFNSQGEDEMAGLPPAADTTRLATSLPHVHARLHSLGGLLEREFGDVQEYAFTVQDGVLYLLLTRSAKRSPWAALRIAVEQVDAGVWSPATALERLTGIDLGLAARSSADPRTGAWLDKVATWSSRLQA